jgi:integrase
MSVEKGHKPGTWRIRVYLLIKNGKREQHQENFNGTKREAQAREREIKRSMDTGSFIGKNKETFGQHIDQWIQACEITLRPKTVTSYRQLAGYASELFDTRLQSVKTADLLIIVSSLVERGLSVTTIRAFVRVMKIAFNRAVDLDKIPTNPAQKVKLPPAKTQIKDLWDKETVKRFVRIIRCTHAWEPAASGEYDVKCSRCNAERKGVTVSQIKSSGELASLSPYAEAFELVLLTGLRRGELAGLRWSNIDLERGILTVVETRNDARGGGYYFQPPKSDAGIRDIQLSTRSIELLSELKETHKIYRMANPSLWPADAWVICQPDGSLMGVQRIGVMFDKIVKRYAFPHLTLHGLRHLYATMAGEAGWDIKAVQHNMGHSTPTLTAQIYQHHRRVEVAQLDAIDDNLG